MKILLLGATGLLGPAMRRAMEARAWNVIGCARAGADLNFDLSDLTALHHALESARPDAVINCAALADLSACERDPSGAYLANARPAGALASWSQDRKAPFVHVSTDCYFTGGGRATHDEDAAPIVLWNEYARTKRAGECFALASPHALVLRTNLVGAKKGFGRFALDLMGRRSDAVLFDDFFTSPLHIFDFAQAALDLLALGACGLFNLAGGHVSSKREIAFAIAHAAGGDVSWVPTGSVRSIQPRRAESLGLDVRRAEALLGSKLPDLEQTARTLAQEAY